mgnify:CR=1 FL=1
MHQLRELRLGAAEEGLTSNKFTAEGFKAVLEALKQIPELAVPEMKLPKEEELDIGNWSSNVGSMEVGDRGATAIAQNLKNLTYLDIGKQ